MPTLLLGGSPSSRTHFPPAYSPRATPLTVGYATAACRVADRVPAACPRAGSIAPRWQTMPAPSTSSPRRPPTSGPRSSRPATRTCWSGSLETAREVTGAAAASIAVLDQRDGDAAVRRCVGNGERPGRGHRDGRRQGHRRVGASHRASRSRSRTRPATLGSRPTSPPRPATRPRSVFAIPLESDAGTMGVMEILDAEEGRDQAHDESRAGLLPGLSGRGRDRDHAGSSATSGACCSARRPTRPPTPTAT